MTTENAYVNAVRAVPKGETRTFGEIAVWTGNSMAARAAGRALTSYPPDGRAPWQRAVNARGGLSIDPERAALQLARLRRDGARPKEHEPIRRWAARVEAARVGSWRNHLAYEPDDPRVPSLDPRYVERFASPQAAVQRGFRPAQPDPRSATRTGQDGRRTAPRRRVRDPSA